MFTNILAFVYQLFWNSSQKVWCNNADDTQKSLYFLAHNSVLRFVHLSVCVEPKCLSISLRMHAHNLFDILIQEKYAWTYGGKTLQCEQRMEDYNGTTNEVNMHIHVINFTFFWSLIWTLACMQQLQTQAECNNFPVACTPNVAYPFTRFDAAAILNSVILFGRSDYKCSPWRIFS